MTDAGASPESVSSAASGPAATDRADADMRALVAALPMGVGILDLELRYLRVNEALARMNGRPVEAHAGASLVDVLGERAVELSPALQRVVRTRETLRFERELVPPGASEPRAYEVTYFPIVDDHDEVQGVGGVVLDVTHHKQLEAEQLRLLREALVARAHSEAAEVRADAAREEAEVVSRDARRGRARMALLAEAGRRMAESMDWETTLEAVVHSAVPEVADWATLAVVEADERPRVVAVAHRDAEREPPAEELLEFFLPGAGGGLGFSRVIATGQMEVQEDVSPDALRGLARDADHLRLLERLGLRHIAIAPLKTPEGVIGALSFVLDGSGRRFEPADRELIASLAARAALHIHNTRLYRDRSHIAQTLQTSLLPDALPVIPGLDVAARYRPAGSLNTVGGDFYDVFRSGDRAWAAIVGDVSGKGAEAAAVTALARHTLRTAARLHDGPAANLALLNEAMVEEGEPASFCTVFYCRLCPDDLRGFDLRFANGGHPSPLLVRADGSIETLDSGRGSLVGAVADAHFEEGTGHLAPGELLLLYTDGVTELRPSDFAFGERELREVVAVHAGDSADAVAAAVEEHVVRLQGGHPRDDIALVAIRAGAATGDADAPAAPETP